MGLGFGTGLGLDNTSQYNMKVLSLFVLYLIIIDLVMTSGNWWTAKEIEKKHEKSKQLKRRGKHLTPSTQHLCQR